MKNLKLNNYYKFSTNVKDHIEMDMGWIVSEWRKLRRTIPEPGLDSISKYMFLTEIERSAGSRCILCFNRKSIGRTKYLKPPTFCRHKNFVSI